MTIELVENSISQRGSAGLDWGTPPQRPNSFETVYEAVESLSKTKLIPLETSPDSRGIPIDKDEVSYDVVDLKTIRFIGGDLIHTEPFGVLEMNSWSKSQLGGLLGVRWDKFFGAQRSEQVQAAVNNHLDSRTTPTLVKLLARSYSKFDNVREGESRGFLRGIVSPSYQDISDLYLFNRMIMVLGSDLHSMHFQAVRMEPEGSHFFLTYNDPFNAVTGKATSNETEQYFFGVRVGNSEVGGRGLTMQPWFVKFICTNGVVIGVEDGPLLYRKHTPIKDGELDELIDGAFMALPAKREEIVEQSKLLNGVVIEEPLEELQRFLKSKSQPKYLVEAAEKAWKEEGEPDTAFGLAQTIARVSVALRSSSDKQEKLEQLAGKFLSESQRRYK